MEQNIQKTWGTMKITDLQVIHIEEIHIKDTENVHKNIIVENYKKLKEETNILIGWWDKENTKQKRLRNKLLMIHDNQNTYSIEQIKDIKSCKRQRERNI